MKFKNNTSFISAGQGSHDDDVDGLGITRHKMADAEKDQNILLLRRFVRICEKDSHVLEGQKMRFFRDFMRSWVEEHPQPETDEDTTEEMHVDPPAAKPEVQKPATVVPPVAPHEETTSGPASIVEGIDLRDFNPASAPNEEEAENAKIRGAQLVEAGDKVGALREYSTAIKLNPFYALAFAKRAALLYQMGYYAEAVFDCDHALEQNPDIGVAYRVRGRSLKQLGQRERALKDLYTSQTIDYNDDAAADIKALLAK